MFNYAGKNLTILNITLLGFFFLQSMQNPSLGETVFFRINFFEEIL